MCKIVYIFSHLYSWLPLKTPKREDLQILCHHPLGYHLWHLTFTTHWKSAIVICLSVICTRKGWCCWVVFFPKKPFVGETCWKITLFSLTKDNPETVVNMCFKVCLFKSKWNKIVYNVLYKKKLLLGFAFLHFLKSHNFFFFNCNLQHMGVVHIQYSAPTLIFNLEKQYAYWSDHSVKIGNPKKETNAATYYMSKLQCVITPGSVNTLSFWNMIIGRITRWK